MRKPVMIQGGTLGFGTGSPVSGGTFTITSTPRMKTKVGGKGVYAGTLTWTFAGGNGAGCTPGSVIGSGSISPGAASVRDDGLFVVLEGDQVSANFQGVASNGATVPFTGVPVKVSSAGQSYMKAD